jgi:hypothetical protein
MVFFTPPAGASSFHLTPEKRVTAQADRLKQKAHAIIFSDQELIRKDTKRSADQFGQLTIFKSTRISAVFGIDNRCGYAVSNIWVAAIDFFRIFPGGTIYPSSFQPRRYPHFSGVRFVCDYLTNTITFSKITKDWFSRRYT